MKTAITNKVINSRSLTLYFVFIIVVTTLLHYYVFKIDTDLSDIVFRAITMIGFALIFIYERVRQPKTRNFFAVAEAVAIGLYDPEDERDTEIKLEAALNAFAVMQLLCWLVWMYYFIIGQGMDFFFKPVSLFAVILTVIGRFVFTRTMRRRGVEFDSDRLIERAKKK